MASKIYMSHYELYLYESSLKSFYP